MNNIQEISPQVFWVGGSDRRLQRFENMLPLPNGMAYNAYLIADQKTALLDTADASVYEAFLENVEQALAGRKLDYLIITHMEPDHCAALEEIIRRYPDVQVVGNEKTFQLFGQYYDAGLIGNRLLVKEKDELRLGSHTLRFYLAPMVHWPEVMFCYETSRGILFSADAFGAFGAHAGNLFADEVSFENGYLDDARRYYSNIVGRFGPQVQAVLKKLAAEDIRMICPLHGLVWRKDLDYILEKYNRWSLYEPEQQGVLILYASMYGNTENAINALAAKLAQKGVPDMRMYDVSNTHPSFLISEVWRYSHLVLAAPTYNLHLYFPMDTLLRELASLNLKNRKVAVIGNHSWASAAMKKMLEHLEGMKGIEIVGTPMDIRSSLKVEQEGELDALADAICASLKGE